MILTCPACATRYQVDEAKFPPEGRQVRCVKCGHAWHQGALTPEASEAASEPKAAPTMAAEPRGADAFSTPAESVPEPPEKQAADPVHPRAYATTRAFAPAAEKGERMGWGARIALAFGWLGLIAMILLIGYAAVRYREEITLLWPQSAGVYTSLGMKVNARGLDFDKVDYHRESEDGQVVLAVTGRIVNNGSRELPVPQSVRVTLSDVANHELYHWNFPPSAQTLKPGQSVPFITRLSSPPAAARHLEVRFAKEGS
jgi:predicted Zn finger-like uncharacterized protein